MPRAPSCPCSGSRSVSRVPCPVLFPSYLPPKVPLTNLNRVNRFIEPGFVSEAVNNTTRPRVLLSHRGAS